MALNQLSKIKVSKTLDADTINLLGASGINVQNFNSFCIQFRVTGVVAPLTGKIKLQVSNNPSEAGFKTLSAPYEVAIDTAGDNTYFIFIGDDVGVNSCAYINAFYEKNASGTGLIENAYLSAKQQ